MVAFSPDGSQIASGHQNRIVKIYDAASLNRIRAFRTPDARADPQAEDYGTTALGYSPDGKFLLAGARDGLIWLLDVAQENPARILRQADGSDLDQFNENRAGQVVATLFSRDGNTHMRSNRPAWCGNGTQGTGVAQAISKFPRGSQLLHLVRIAVRSQSRSTMVQCASTRPIAGS